VDQPDRQCERYNMNSKAIFLLVIIGTLCLQTSVVSGFWSPGHECICVSKWKKCPLKYVPSHPQRCWWKCKKIWKQCCCPWHGYW
ncbi:hypothetical protein KUTeg_002664, partial [Tegillarca granosa]